MYSVHVVYYHINFLCHIFCTYSESNIIKYKKQFLLIWFYYSDDCCGRNKNIFSIIFIYVLQKLKICNLIKAKVKTLFKKRDTDWQLSKNTQLVRCIDDREIERRRKREREKGNLTRSERMEWKWGWKMARKGSNDVYFVTVDQYKSTVEAAPDIIFQDVH